MQLPEIAERLPRATVVVLGDVVADEYVYGETERVSREAPVLVVRHQSSEIKPGGAGNVAANVAALGARARPVGLVGDDPAGHALARQLGAAGADVSSLLRVPGRFTETKTRILAGGRSTTRQQMLRVDRADERPPSAAVRRRVLQRLQKACRGAGALVVSDYGSGLLDPALVDAVRALASQLPVCVDSRYNLRAYRGVTLLKPNEPELESVVGRRLDGPGAVEQAGRALLQSMGARALVVTRGRLGMELFEEGRDTVRIPVHGPEEAVDVTGAGDTVLATLASALACGASLEQAARLANIAGGIVVQKPGTATCSHAELAAAVGAPVGRARAGGLKERARAAARRLRRPQD